MVANMANETTLELYAILHTLIHTLCLSKYAILPIKLTADARSLQNLSPWNSKSIRIMPSVLTCAVIILCIVWTLTYRFQRCMHVWLNNKVEIFVWKTSKFLWLQPVKISRIHMLLSWMSRSALAQLSSHTTVVDRDKIVQSILLTFTKHFCACAAQLSSYTTVLDRYKIDQSILLTFTKHVGMVKDT